MTNPTKFRVQAGALLFEMEGEQEFVRQQMDLHHEHIEMILAEQAKLVKSGKIPVSIKGRRGRPARKVRTDAEGGARRPGRQPVIIRESSLTLKPRALSKLDKFLAGLADGVQLGKDATVFAMAYFLCTEVLHKETFTAGDISAATAQLGEKSYLPAADSVDIVQMLRNLAAASIGKQWVDRNPDGTFALTEKGKNVGESGGIVRPRGRRPGAVEPTVAPAPQAAQAVAKPGRPRKNTASAEAKPVAKATRERKSAKND